MIVTCPNCATRYQLDPDALVPNGRYLRCVKCSHQWLERPAAATGGAAAPADEDNFDDLLPPQPRTRRRPPARGRGRPPPRRSRVAKLVPWAALVLILVVVLGGSVLARKQIVAMLPFMAPLYETAGLAVERPQTPRFEVRNVVTEQRREGDNTVIAVRGEVHNLTAEVQALPEMIAVLRDVNDREIHFWKFSGPVPELQPGQTAEFSTSITNPPANARSLIVNFAAPTPPAGG